MNVRVAKQEDSDKICEFIRRMDTSSLYHDYVWMGVIEEIFRQRCYYLVCENAQNRISGVLPLVQLKSLLFGNYMVSVPYFNYGGVCAEDRETMDALIEAGIGIAERVGARHIEFRQQDPIEIAMPSKTRKVSMRLALPDDPVQLWNSFPSKLRSQIRGTEKKGLTATIGKMEELDSFYNVFSINMRDLGTPVYPKRFFGRILEKFRENAWICTVYRGNAPLASGFLLCGKNGMEIPWASSIRKFNSLSPNMLLYWKCLEFATRCGYTAFDFGRSTAGESTYRFKEQWGAKPVQLNWYYWLKNRNAIPEISPANPKYELAIKVWKKLPLPLTRLLGPCIVKNLP
jgi:serine/alanine adding enzyme